MQQGAVRDATRVRIRNAQPPRLSGPTTPAIGIHGGVMKPDHALQASAGLRLGQREAVGVVDDPDRTLNGSARSNGY